MNLRAHATYSNVVASLALLVAIAGGTTAVAVKTKLPKNSVTAKAIKPNAVTAKAIAPDAVGSDELANGAVGANQLGTIVAHELGTGGVLNCPAGQRLITGGATSGGLFSSAPSGANGWLANGSGNTTIRIVCLAP